MGNILLNDKPAVLIAGKLIKPGKKASLYDCEGDKVWIPNSVHKYRTEQKKIVVQEWWYNNAVENGQL